MVNLANLSAPFLNSIGCQSRKDVLSRLSAKGWNGKHFKDMDSLYWHLLYLINAGKSRPFLKNIIKSSSVVAMNDSFSNTPHVLLVFIASFLGERDILALTKVSTVFNGSFTVNEIWKRFMLLIPTDIVEPYINIVIKSKAPNNYFRCYHHLSDDVFPSICGNCNLSNGFRLITKTNAKKEYKLTEQELCEMKSISYESRTYGRGVQVNLYFEREVKAMSDKFHSAQVSRSVERKKKIEIQRRKTRETRRKQAMTVFDESVLDDNLLEGFMTGAETNLYVIQARVNRRNALVLALSDMKLTLRNDSMLCSEYIYNGVGQIANIVREMCLMKWLYEHTDYPRIRNDVYEDNRYRLEDMPHGFITEEAKRRVLNKRALPDIFPWML